MRYKTSAIAAVLMMFCITGCTTSRGTFCDIAKPIRLSSAAIDAMSDAEVAAALAHDRKGEKLCGWKP